MPELRWALVVLGVLFVAGLAIWEWRRSRRRRAASAEGASAGVPPQGGGETWPRRVEPRIDSLAAGRAHSGPGDALLGEVPVVQPMASVEVSLPVAPGAAVDVPGAASQARDRAARSALSGTDDVPQVAGWQSSRVAAEPAPQDPAGTLTAASSTVDAVEDTDAASPDSPVQGGTAPPAIRWPPERADRVLTLRIANAHGALLQGRAVRLALEQAGLVPGPQTIYHRIDAQGHVLASAANMLRPGDLDPAGMDEQQFRGLSMFTVLPGPLPPVRMLEELVSVARALAWRLGAVVQDDQGMQLEGERLVALRQSLPDPAEHGNA